MRPSRKNPKVRLNLDISVEVKEQIESIRDRTQADSMGEVVRRALSVYSYLLANQTQNSKIVIRSSDGEELQFFIL